MEKREITSQVNSIIQREHSTQECLRSFEQKLADLESKGEQYTQNTFLRIRRYFRNKLERLAESHNQDNPDYARELELLGKLICSIEKSKAFDAIGSTRKSIRKNIPEFAEEDKNQQIKEKVEQFLNPHIGDIKATEIADAILTKDNIKLRKFAYDTPYETVIAFYGFLTRLDPNEPLYPFLLTKYAFFNCTIDDFTDQLSQITNPTSLRICAEAFLTYRLQNRPRSNSVSYLELAILLIEDYLDTPHNIAQYAICVRKLNNTAKMKRVLPLLNEHLDDPDCINEYGRIVKTLGLTAQIDIALVRIEKQPFNLNLLVTYATLARTAQDKSRMKNSLKLLADHIDNPQCINIYAAISKDLDDTDLIELSLLLLSDHLDDPILATTYAALARKIKDLEAVEYSMRKLEPHLTDKICCHAYALNAIHFGNRRQRSIALYALKQHIDDTGCRSLYLELADNFAEIEEVPISSVRPFLDELEKKSA